MHARELPVMGFSGLGFEWPGGFGRLRKMWARGRDFYRGGGRGLSGRYPTLPKCVARHAYPPPTASKSSNPDRSRFSAHRDVVPVDARLTRTNHSTMRIRNADSCAVCVMPRISQLIVSCRQMITLGKKGTETAKRSAQAMLMVRLSAFTRVPSPSLTSPRQPAHHYGVSSTPLPQAPISPAGVTEGESTSLLPKLFGTLAERYAARPGGYTRVTKYGRRPGDNAEQCLLSLVDSERDVKREMTARAVGREVVERLVGSGKGREALHEGVRGCLKSGAGLSERTWRDAGKVLRYRTEGEVDAFADAATRYAVSTSVRGADAERRADAVEVVRAMGDADRREERTRGARATTDIKKPNAAVRPGFPLPAMTSC